MPAGRPKIEWSEKEIKIFEGLCAVQCTKDEICFVMQVTDKTLDRLLKEQYGMNFSDSYKKCGAGGKVSLRRAQFRLAERNAAMAIWLGKQYLGQSEHGVIGEGSRMDDGLIAALERAGEVWEDGEHGDIPV